MNIQNWIAMGAWLAVVAFAVSVLAALFIAESKRRS